MFSRANLFGFLEINHFCGLSKADVRGLAKPIVLGFLVQNAKSRKGFSFFFKSGLRIFLLVQEPHYS